VTYSPKHVGLISGLVGAFLSPNEWIAGGMVVFGWAWDNVATYIDRRAKKGDGKNAD
jgi:hypothetical protein